MRARALRCTLSLALALAGMLGVGCGSTAPTETSEPVICNIDAQCDGELVCDRNLCVAAGEQLQRLQLRFYPPGSSKYLVQRDQFRDYRLGLEEVVYPSILRQTASLQGQLINRVEVDGEVRRQERSVSGVLSFSNPELVQPRTAKVTEGSFALPILPGSYDVRFRPDTQTLPEQIWQARRVASNLLLDLTYPEQFFVFRGFLQRRFADDVTEAVANAQVVAISRSTGALSSVDISNSNGLFELRLPADSGRYDLLARDADSGGAFDEDGKLLPDVLLEDSFEAGPLGTEDEATPSFILGTSSGDAKTVVSFCFTDSSTAEPNDQPNGDCMAQDLIDSMSGTQIYLESDVGLGKLRRTRLWSSPGDDLELTPGRYRAVILPPPRAPLGARNTELLIGGNSRQLTIALDPRPRIEGQLVDALGQPMADASIELRTRADNSWRPFGLQPTPRFTAQSDEEGKYALRYDPQLDYLLIAVPPPRSFQPRLITSLPRQEDDSYPDQLPLQLPQPRLFVGFVLDQQRAPMPDTQVQAYAEREGELLQVGNARVNAQGRFEIILPDHLPEQP